MRLIQAGLAIALSVAVTGAASAEQLVIKFSHVVAESTPKGVMANKFRDLVHERLGDRVKVEVYPNSQLFDDDKVLSAMRLGEVHFAAPSLSKFGKYTKKLQVFDLPFLFKDMAAVEQFQNSDAGQKLLHSMESKGFIGLGYLHNGLKQLSANKELRVPGDANGLKFRIQASNVIAAQFEAVGATPIKKPFSEVFTLLQTKALDGQENTWSNIYSKKFHEVQEAFTESNHGVIDYLVVTSAKFWTELPDDLRSELKKALDEAIAEGNAVSNKLATDARKKVIDSGRTKILELTDAERQQWVDAMKPVWSKFEDEIGKDLIEAAANPGT